MAGEEFDEEEQKIVSGVNNAILKKLPYSVDMVPAEEQLMLLGHASTAEEASLILTGGRKRTIVPQLYSAPDPEEASREPREGAQQRKDHRSARRPAHVAREHLPPPRHT